MIRVESLSYRAGRFSLEDISFTVDKGETLVVLGPTGAGKTVLLELIAGIRTPRGGTVRFDDVDLTYEPPERRKVGLVYQDYLLFPHLTVADNIAYGLRVSGMRSHEARIKVQEIALKFGIEHLLERRTRNLSGGEQQRTAIARTLVTEPKILLLDEPFSAVDPNTKDQLMREMSDMLESFDMPVVYVTHDQVEAAEMADRIAVMNEGRIVQVDTPEGVFAAPKSEFVANFVGIRNVLRGQARRVGDHTVVSLGVTEVCSSAGIEGKVNATIRPEDIIVSKERLVSSARNSLSGKVVSVSEKGPLVFVTADCGTQLTAAITRESFRELRVTVGDTIYMTFKASSVNLF